ncbi:MAG: deoxynucleoside kinase [Candidatus Delongbacteria bacterium]|nr:deoxynucleoside kinase [Candidatus Delongbacteria bacterium]MBN2833807.1 deoxynucleoside kinase [Candidatus Delongbacteria bacterium]
MYVFDQIYIAVEGVTGSGKNNFAKVLSDKLKAKKLFESILRNPFLHDYYKDPEKADLTTQLSFMISRYELLRDFGYDDLFNQRTVANFIFDKDKIYSSYVLSDENKFDLYNSIASKYNEKLFNPDVVVYLRSKSDQWLFDKVLERKRSFEKNITLEYIAGLNESYEYFFNNYNKSQLVIVDIDKNDFDLDVTVETLVNHLKEGLINKLEL